jgi:hypothetical protein
MGYTGTLAAPIRFQRVSKHLLSRNERAARLQQHSRFPIAVCLQFLNAFYQNDNRKLAIQAEKYLLNADQNEGLKERGLTIYDCIIGDVESYDTGFVTEMFATWNEVLGEKLYIIGAEA